MKRSAPMKRTPLRATGPARTTVKVRKCAVKECRQPFVPRSMTHKACGPECAEIIGRAKAEKERQAVERAERAAIRERKQAIRKIGDLESDCRKIVQEIARIRDKDAGCISCHMGPNYDGQWHGSHYRAHGGCSSLQMHLWNIHKACAQCNLFKGGNKEGFIAGLLKKPGYGRERIDWLDCQPKSKRFSRDYLLRFKAVMGRRLRRLKKCK